MKAYGRTDVGRIRAVNQDAYYVPGAGESFAIVADGMGGHRAGEVASRIAVEEFRRWLRCAPRPNEEAIRYAVSEANRKIYDTSKREPDKAGMGTTLTALWFDTNRVYMAHIGDSRVYRVRDNMIAQLSRDHSVVADMVLRGEITAEEAKVHPHRHYITRAMGTSKYVAADIRRYDRIQGDIWLLCSDGLSNYIEADEMLEILLSHEEWEEKLNNLINLALRRGGADNITALIVVDDRGDV